MFTVYNNTLAVKALAATTISTDTATSGAAVDTALYANNFRDVAFIVSSHALTDGAFVVAVEESDATDSGWGAVESSRVLGPLPSFTASEDDVVKSLGVRPTKRYVRVVVTSASTDAGGTLSAVAVLGNGGNNPVARG